MRIRGNSNAFSDVYTINVAKNNRPQTVNCCEFIPRPVTSGASFGWTHLINPELCIQISIMFVPPHSFWAGAAPDCHDGNFVAMTNSSPAIRAIFETTPVSAKKKIKFINYEHVITILCTKACHKDVRNAVNCEPKVEKIACKYNQWCLINTRKTILFYFSGRSRLTILITWRSKTCLLSIRLASIFNFSNVIHV